MHRLLLSNIMIRILFVLLLPLLSMNALSDAGFPYGIKMVTLDSGETRHIKFNAHTGEAWWSKNTVWKKIKDVEELSISNYEFSVVSTGSSWRVLRIDKLTGQTWKNSRGKWVAFTHQASH